MSVVRRIPLLRGLVGRAERREELAARTRIVVEAARENTRLNRALAGHLDELERDVMAFAAARRRGESGRSGPTPGGTS